LASQTVSQGAATTSCHMNDAWQRLYRNNLDCSKQPEGLFWPSTQFIFKAKHIYTWTGFSPTVTRYL